MQFRVVEGKHEGKKVYGVQYKTLFRRFHFVTINGMVSFYPTYNKATDAMRNFAIRYGDKVFGKLKIK